MKIIHDISKIIRCVFDWPMLHMRILCYTGITFAIYEFDKIRALNSDSALHRTMKELGVGTKIF